MSDGGRTRREFLRDGGLVALGAAALSAGPRWAGGPRLVRAAGPVKGGVLKVAQIGDPPTLDCIATTADVTATDTQSMLESLFALDAKGVPQPMLATAEQWSNGNLTLTMPLRQGVTFHDGSPMTAADVVASLKRWLKLASLGQETAAEVKDITAKDDRTVVIQLAHPVGLLTSYLANPNNMAAIMPRGLLEQHGDKPVPTPIGTGPYRLADLADATGKSISGIRTAYTTADVDAARRILHDTGGAYDAADRPGDGDHDLRRPLP